MATTVRLSASGREAALPPAEPVDWQFKKTGLSELSSLCSCFTSSAPFLPLSKHTFLHRRKVRYLGMFH